VLRRDLGRLRAAAGPFEGHAVELADEPNARPLDDFEQ
jgi:hypothetical protein